MSPERLVVVHRSALIGGRTLQVPPSRSQSRLAPRPAATPKGVGGVLTVHYAAAYTRLTDWRHS